MARTEVPLNDVTRPTWQRKDLVVLALHEGCEVCDAAERALATPAPAVRGPLRDPELSVRVLHGPEGDGLKAAVGVGADDAVALVTDRFLELFAVLEVHRQTPQAFVAELSSWADAVARQCGECSRMQFD